MKNECGWLDESELPVNVVGGPGVVERDADRDEFVRCFVLTEFELLLSIPKPEPAQDFFVENFEESAFNTHDFDFGVGRQPFSGYHYRIKKILERVRDLALMHSCITDEERGLNVRRRFEAVVDSEFRDRLLRLAELHSKSRRFERRQEFKRQVAELNRHIMRCERIWREHGA